MSTLLFESYDTQPDIFKSRFQEYCKFSIILGFVISVGAIFTAKQYLSLFYDITVYKESIFCFKILMGSFLIMLICIPLHTAMLAAHQEKLTLKIILFQLTCNITGNWILIPLYGIMGSAFSTVLTELIGLPLYLIFIQRILPVRIFRTVVQGGVSIIPMGLYLYFSSPLTHFIIKGLIGAGIAGLTIMALRVYTLKEILYLKDTLLSFEKRLSS